MFIYITFDSNGFVTDYKKVETDGYTKVFVLDSWINQFAQYPDKFRYDSTNQTLLNPGNLPVKLVSLLESTMFAVAALTAFLTSVVVATSIPDF